MMIKWKVVLCGCCSFLLGGCLIGSDLVRDEIKGGNYSIWAMEMENQTQFIRANDGADWPGTTLVGPTVINAGWDDNWVLMEQAALDDFAKQVPTSAKRQFYIFRLADGELFGPYNHQVFVQKRSKLGVPATLDLDRNYVKD